MPDETHYELTASVVLWRGPEILVMKRASGFSSGGWFIPGGHVEPGERPVAAAARELREETGIIVAEESLSLADVMTFPAHGGTAHSIIYNAAAPPGADAVINEEHLVARWMTPAAYIGRFLDPAVLAAKGVPLDAIELASEVARAITAAARARGMNQKANHRDAEDAEETQRV